MRKFPRFRGLERAQRGRRSRRCGHWHIAPPPSLRGEASHFAACRLSRVDDHRDAIAYIVGLVIVGLVVERSAPAASLPAFLAMYFVFLWVAWVIAVRVTQPRMQPR
jgi:hypothetical protein